MLGEWEWWLVVENVGRVTKEKKIHLVFAKRVSTVVPFSACFASVWFIKCIVLLELNWKRVASLYVTQYKPAKRYSRRLFRLIIKWLIWWDCGNLSLSAWHSKSWWRWFDNQYRYRGKKTIFHICMQHDALWKWGLAS